MLSDHVVDQFRDQHGFAHTCPAKQARLAATFQRSQQVNGFDPGFKDARVSRSIGKLR